LMVPSVVSAVKFGASSPSLNAMVTSFIYSFQSYDIANHNTILSLLVEVQGGTAA
jgi:hypothetical protein